MTTRSPASTPLRLQRIREPAHLRVQLAIAQPAHVARLAFENDRGLVAALGEMHVQAVVGDVQPAVGEPAVVRRAGVIERHRERRLPVQLLARQVRPESDVIFRRLLSKLLHVGWLEPGMLGKFGGGANERSSSRTDTIFLFAMVFPSKT